ncbi:MAG TPA: helix-turn-helix domain-containing protein [Stellaceae bacterium]|nr:helix-turn-helix domain-containing protein [Stellaceae bacterium]
MTRAYAYRGEALKDQPLHYTGCGLDDVYLLNGYAVDNNEEYGRTISVKDLDGLRRVIGAQLVRKKLLKGKELRFLRTEMDLTQSELGRLIGYSDQQVARWEKDQSRIPAPANRMIRLLVREHLSNDRFSVREVLDHLDRMDNTISDRQVFEKAGRTWRVG